MTKHSRPETPLYPKHHKPWELEPYYSQHISGMTEFELHDKADIAEQLAWRDIERANLHTQLVAARSILSELARVLGVVATQAAAMLSETNHGGLTASRSEAMRLALVAAGVAIPSLCSACPHPVTYSGSLPCPHGCRGANNDPVMLVNGQRCPECTERTYHP